MSTTTEAAAKKTITLKSSDGETFEVDDAVAVESQTIKHMIEQDDCADNEILLPNVTSKILAKVIEYCKKHVEATAVVVPKEDENKEDLVKKWDVEFVKVDQATLFELLLAANYLNIKSLVDLGCRAVADMVKDKSPEEIRMIFNIKNELTPEEEEFRRGNQWVSRMTSHLRKRKRSSEGKTSGVLNDNVHSKGNQGDDDDETEEP